MKNFIIKFLVMVLLIGSLFTINPIGVNADNIESQPIEGMYDWVLDEENGNIYAFSYNELSILSLTDLAVKKEIPIDEYFMDVELVDGKLYVLDSYNQVQVINTTTLTVEKTMLLDEENLVWDIAIDEGKVFFTFSEDSFIYYYDLTTDVIGTAVATTYYDAVITTDSANDVLFIGESGKTSSRLESISTTSYEYLTKSANNFDSPEPIIYFSNGDLFYAGYSINGNNLAQVNGYYNGEVWFVNDLYVLTETSLYDRESYEKLNDIDYVLIDGANNVYAFTENETIIKTDLISYLDNYSGNPGANLDLPEPPAELFNYLPYDLDNGWADEYLFDFLAADLLTGSKDADGNVLLQPNKQITRAEFVAILVRILGLTDATGAADFADVSSGKWYYDSVRIANANGLITGLNENEFAPERPIRRDEMATIIVRAFEDTIDFNGEPKQFNDVGDYWAKPAIDQASSVGIITGTTDETFSPFANAKRSEAVTMLYRAVRLESSDLPEDSELISIVSDYYYAVDEAFNAYQFDQKDALVDQYITGFYNVLQKYNNDLLAAVYDSGARTQTMLVGEPVYSVLEKSNNFATIEVEGLVYENTTQFNETSETETQDLSGTYYLKKMPTGEWKIYNAYLPNLVIQ